jgi:hypothetical protein
MSDAELLALHGEFEKLRTRVESARESQSGRAPSSTRR